jgi:multidrug resistance efflux pump
MSVPVEERGVQAAPTSATAGALDAEWAALAGADTAEALCRAWLELLCRMVRQARGGLLLLADTDGVYAPAGLWPEGADLSHLAPVAQEVLTRREGLIARDGGPGQARLAYPLADAERLHGAVVLDLAGADEAALSQAMRLTHWGSGWLLELFGRRAAGLLEARLEQAGFLLDTLLAVAGEGGRRQGALALVNRFAGRFGCHQVLLGVERGRRIEVLAMSHAAWFDARANLVRFAAAAMDEACDQRARILWPEQDAPDPRPDGSLGDPAAPPPAPLQGPAAAHARYAREGGSAVLLSQPFETGGRVAAVLLLERDTPFDAAELDAIETAALVLAPTVGLQERAEEGLLTHAGRAGTGLAARLVDGSHAGLKLAAALLALVLLALGLWQTDYRVSAPAVLEGAVQRLAAAPFDGYIAEAPVRAGDRVRAGQPMAALQDEDLRLERTRWEAELELALRREREALAAGERVAARLAGAQAEQARAQLDLALGRLARAEIRAPLDGLVVQGDLSQQLGAPVRQGDVLFVVAPLDAWRVVLKVDARDIARLAPGQPGELVLASLAGRAWPLAVRSVTPVATSEEGRSWFRVEADLAGAAAGGADTAPLRPNMEGVAKVRVGERSLLWIWTHGLWDWARIAWWRLVP